MASEFKSSFIPRSPVTEEVFKKKKAGLLGVLSVALFVSSIVIAGALYFYKGVLRGEIEGLQAQLAEEEKNIDKKTIKELSDFDQKLKIAQDLTVKHTVLSNFLNALASSTVSSVQFNEFSYSDGVNGGMAVKLKGRAAGYASLALQDSVFASNEYFKTITFDNLTLSDKGYVTFDVDIALDPKISVYSP